MSTRWLTAVSVWGGVLVSVVLGAPALGLACDTPVYRYAMYRWLPAPYEVYHFYRGTLDESAAAVKENLDRYRDPEQVPANAVFLPVDLDKDAELRMVPPDVKEKWLALESPELPTYLIVSPLGVQLHRGQLTLDDLELLVDSPIRQKIGAQLRQGAAGVFLLLPGNDDEANRKAEQLLQGVVADVNSGKVNLYSAPGLSLDPEESEAAAMRPQAALISMKRDDPQEVWFTRTLRAMERDLPTVTDPIVFLIYGRGRALFSCLGQGITRDILLQDIDFITGACSCTVKDQNPGIDLLMRYDWDAAAMHLARAFSGEEGSEYQAGGENVFPELIIPSGGGESTDPPADGMAAQGSLPGDSADVTAEAAVPTASAAGESAAGGAEPAPGVEPTPDAPRAAAPATPAGEDPGPAGADRQASVDRPASTAAASPASSSASALGSVMVVGIGLLGLLAGLFAATFFVLRPK